RRGGSVARSGTTCARTGSARRGCRWGRARAPPALRRWRWSRGSDAPGCDFSTVYRARARGLYCAEPNPPQCTPQPPAPRAAGTGRQNRAWVREDPLRMTGLKTLDEVRQAVAVLATGNGDALDRLAWTGVFGAPGVRDAARQGVLDECRS